VTGITPAFANNDAPAHISDLSGSNFRSGATVKLHRRTDRPRRDSVTVVSPARITCDLDITGAATGSWDVTVTNDDASHATLADAFDVQYPPPVLAGMSPTTGAEGQTLTGVNITGSAFRNTPMTVASPGQGRRSPPATSPGYQHHSPCRLLHPDRCGRGLRLVALPAT